MIFALIFVLGAFFVFFDFVEPAYSSVETLRGKQIGEESYLTSQSSLVKQMQSSLNNYENQNQANVGLALPSGQNVSGALAQIEGIAATNSVTITNITVSAPTLQVGTSTSNGAMQKPLGSFSLKIAGTGAYENFKNFITEIETNIRLFDITGFSLQPLMTATGAKSGAITQDMFTGNITVVAYYQTL
jgi:hypothetical protein